MFLEFKANGSGREYYDQYDAVEKFNYVVIAYSNELKKGVVRITLSDGQQSEYIFNIGSNTLFLEDYFELTYYKQ